jgi:hypothetical protein
MKFSSNLKPLVISLFPLALLAIQNPAMALISGTIKENFHRNSGLNPTPEFTKKQPIQIAEDDYYWGPQRDFQIWMPGEVVKNDPEQLMTMNTTTQTVYMISHKDIPLDIDPLTSKQIREVLQTVLREDINMKGEVVKSTNMVIEGYPGIELLIQHSDGSRGQYQGYVVKRRLYLIGARTLDELTTEATNFFDSFRVYPSRIVNK